MAALSIRRKSAVARFLGSRVRIPSRARMHVSDVNVVCLTGRDLSDGPIPSPVQPYRVCMSCRM
jgi:hypothetical protein